MSRRPDRRDRRQNDTSDRSKRILQISLVSAGVLLLVIALVIAVGLPMGSSLLANGEGSGDNGGNGDTGGTKAPATTSSEPKQTPQKDQATTTTTEKKTTTEQQTTTTTQQTQQQPQNSGKMQVVKKRDRDGDGSVSHFSLSINVDTTRNEYKNRNLHFIISINGKKVDTTKRLDPNPNGYMINLDRSTLRNHQSKQGTMRVSVKLIEKGPGKNSNLNTWTTRVKYEPRENTNK